MKTQVKMPSIDSVYRCLVDVKHGVDWQQDFSDDDDKIVDVRLQVYENGQWAIREGDASYDTDHHGYWGASTLEPRSNCRELARDLIDQAAEHAAQSE